MSDKLKIVHQHKSRDGKRTTIVVENVDPSNDSGPSLTGEAVWKLEIQARRLYAKMLLVSGIATTWVYLYGGWTVLVLVPIWALFTTFLDTPTIRSREWVMRDFYASKDRDVEQWKKSRSLFNQLLSEFVFFAAFAPFILIIYVILRH